MDFGQRRISCSSTSEVASEVIWDAGKTSDVVMLVVGLAIGAVALVICAYVILTHRSLVLNRIESTLTGLHIIPDKIAAQQAIMLLGPVATLGHMITLCMPELFAIQDLVTTTYKGATCPQTMSSSNGYSLCSAKAYWDLTDFVKTQFGGTMAIFRDDETGSMQQHPPMKIWNQAPYCFCWSCCMCSDCWKDHIMQGKEARVVMWLIYQFLVIAPLASIAKVFVTYEGASADARLNIFMAATIVGLISLTGAIYSNSVMNEVAESCVPLEEQQRLKYPMATNQSTLNEVASNHNLKQKTKWLVFITALPMIGYLVIQQFINDECVNGHLLTAEARTAFISSFVSLCICLLGSLLMIKAFPMSEDLRVGREYLAGIEMTAELLPSSALRRLIEVNSSIILKRQQEGIDPELGYRDDCFPKLLTNSDDDQLAPKHDLGDPIAMPSHEEPRSNIEMKSPKGLPLRAENQL